MTIKDVLGYYAKHYSLTDQELSELIDTIVPMNDEQRLNFWREHNLA